MSYPIRFFEPDCTYFVTSRCFQARLFLRPSEHTNEIIGSTLARAARMYDVKLYAFAFLSNHFHLLLSAPAGWRIVRFMQFLQSNIARKVGRLIGWRNRFFDRRYSAEKVVDNEAQVDRLRYILAHGVKEGLVERCAEWPGLSCLELIRTGVGVQFRWRDWTQRWFAHRRATERVEHFGPNCPMQVEVLFLHPLPCWRGLSQKTRAEEVAVMESTINAQSGPALGSRAVLEQDPLSAPRSTKRTNRPKCHASSLLLWKEYVAQIGAIKSAYIAASKRWCSGATDVIFPPYCFRPPILLLG